MSMKGRRWEAGQWVRYHSWYARVTWVWGPDTVHLRLFTPGRGQGYNFSDVRGVQRRGLERLDTLPDDVLAAWMLAELET
jgi:hypothetical protein